MRGLRPLIYTKRCREISIYIFFITVSKALRAVQCCCCLSTFLGSTAVTNVNFSTPHPPLHVSPIIITTKQRKYVIYAHPYSLTSHHHGIALCLNPSQVSPSSTLPFCMRLRCPRVQMFRTEALVLRELEGARAVREFARGPPAPPARSVGPSNALGSRLSVALPACLASWTIGARPISHVLLRPPPPHSSRVTHHSTPPDGVWAPTTIAFHPPPSTHPPTHPLTGGQRHHACLKKRGPESRPIGLAFTF